MRPCRPWLLPVDKREPRTVCCCCPRHCLSLWSGGFVFGVIWAWAVVRRRNGPGKRNKISRKRSEKSKGKPHWVLNGLGGDWGSPGKPGNAKAPGQVSAALHGAEKRVAGGGRGEGARPRNLEG